jgi:hypothetical protein
MIVDNRWYETTNITQAYCTFVAPLDSRSGIVTAKELLLVMHWTQHRRIAESGTYSRSKQKTRFCEKKECQLQGSSSISFCLLEWRLQTHHR